VLLKQSIIVLQVALEISEISLAVCCLITNKQFSLISGLAFDEYDIDYYTKLFRDEIGRNPTSVECFDLAQSNR